MKKFFLIVCCVCCVLAGRAQQADVLNKYKSVFIPPLSYGKGLDDIYGIRQTTIEKLTGSGIPLFLSELEIARASLKNPCSMLQCLVNNSAPKDGKNRSVIYILFLDCKNDTVLMCSARADISMTTKETKASFVIATKQALELFNDYRYLFDKPDSSSQAVQPTSTTADSILWSPDRKLTWDDFKGTAKDGEPADALTYTSNQTNFSAFGLERNFEVESEIHCFFIKSKSWVRPGKLVESLLNHEQRHFDLAEASAREYRKRMKQTRFTTKNFRSEVKRITDEVNEKYHTLQSKYDDETDHSRLEEKQLEWNAKIDEMLKALEEYK